MTDDPAWPLARHICRTSYADLPASAIESVRRDILDTFGCMLGGSGAPGIDELFAVALVGFRGGGAHHLTRAADKGAEQGFSAPARVVHELKEAEIDWQLLLRDAAMRTQPGAEQ